MKRYVGEMLIATGVLHTLVGFVVYWHVLLEIGRNRFFNTVSDFGDSGAAFWFLMFGVLLMVLGDVGRQHHAATGDYPLRYGLTIAAIGLVGGLMMPTSGFWIVLAIGFIALRPEKVNAAA